MQRLIACFLLGAILGMLVNISDTLKEIRDAARVSQVE